ncbi:citron Rho-interacting kinase [Tribolium castaneum]|uniref:citron Rho-interacting kinase n=1 Tax=Tribolium castaneum TaxID=7070 RepID=UPI00077DB48E|nr:PREDICTED: citron Rho-interacting kinase [Tribolium castaneum]|eukprot:XP_015836485.1 PREDICTED: citron Rho-interacting kinase [Tribolium castaneum]
MEASQESISSRRDKLNTQIIGDQKLTLINRECLLDALQALYDECSLDALQKYDKQIAQFVSKYKNTLLEVKKLRVNETDFEIKDVIGRGHFGEVHVVKEKQTGDIYAMKTIRKCDSFEKTNFDVERDIMAFAASPWITSLQYAFQDSVYLYYVMEYHPGGDLLGLLYRQGGTLPESAATFYLAEIVLALEDLHSMGFVHRDIKPDNILLDRCGHLKLVDFGSAAKLNQQGAVDKGLPVGTPDYIAPEVLQSLERNSKSHYGVSCDFWSLGALAFELVVGKPPFSGQNTSVTYSRIINHSNNLKFPQDVCLTQAYVSLVRGLLTEAKARLRGPQIKKHPLFKHIHFDSLRDQVPPYVPKISSMEDTSNFADVGAKKTTPSMENFKKKTQFSGRNLPFIGFTFTPGASSCGREFDRNSRAKDEIIRNMREELEVVRRDLMKREDFEEVKLVLEKKILEKNQKLENIESVREKLERDLAASMAESTALKRTLEIERKDRAELERKALDLIKSAKIKWETSERNKIESLKLEIEQQKEKIAQLGTTNKMLNEQLQKAFKMENKHKESIEAVEHLNRRSVIGLESRIEKVALDSKQKIMSLQATLDETIKQKKELEFEIEKLKDSEDELRKKLSKSCDDYTVLNGAALEAEKLVKELGQKVGDFEREFEKAESYKAKIKTLSREIDDFKAKIRDLENANLLLKEENKSIEEFKNQINSLKDTKVQNERKINELESKLQEEEQKCVTLKKELDNSQNLINESQQLKELRVKMWKMEKELGNAKIDKRIVERELKDAENEIKNLNEEIKNLKDKIEENRKIHSAALLELNNINENLSLEMVKVRESHKNLEENLESEKNRNGEEKQLIVQLRDTISEKNKTISTIQSQLQSSRHELATLEEKNQKLLESNLKKSKQFEEISNEKEKLSREVNETKRQLENAQTNLEALREACLIIENQVIEYEKINSSIQAEKSSLAENTEKLIKDLCKAKEEIQEAKKATNEEKSLRLLAETKAKRLAEDVELLQNECEAYKDQCFKFKECSNNLSEELTLSEERVSDLEVTLKSYERQIEDFVSESNILKEEISQYLTQMAALKESNFKLKQQIQDLKEARNVLVEKVEELERVLNGKVNYYEEREMKNESIIKQQTKLIEYLQVKIDEHNSKKRTLTDKLFGSKKENVQPLVLPVNKDLEGQLAKQKQINKNLQEEIYKLKAELNCRTPITKVQRHKSEIVSPKTRSPQIISHKFILKLCKNLTRCDHCAKQIMVGRDVNTCTKCHVNVHQNCVSSVKSTCGLPNTCVKNRKSESNVVIYEGWIKLLTKNNTWDKKYACLTDSKLNVYLTKDKKSLTESFDLKLPNSRKKVVLEPLPSEIGVNVASTDLPFVMKVEVLVQGGPMVSMVFMALSVEERNQWYKAFQELFDEAAGQHLEAIFTLPDQIYANCVLDLTKNIKVLGTDQGLFSYHNDQLVHIEGPTDIHHISIIPNSNTVVMISDLTSILISCDLNHLINLTQCAPCTKPVLNYRTINIKEMDGFHYLQTSKFPKHQLFCAATCRQLVIVKYDCENYEFVPLRIMDTAEPLGCALFTEHSLIVGADKFFEIDLATFKAEEFLDGSDARLKFAVKCHKMQSFPVAILEISQNPKEFLVCFNEFSVFVDEYGRSSREEELKTSYLPIGFHFVAPFLYIIQYSGVEVLKVGGNVANVTVDLKNMRFLGESPNGIYLYHDGRVKLLEGRRVVDCDDVSSVSQSEAGDEDRFSFTSSMVQSLDGNSSDLENSSEENVRRVKFSQTNL